MSRPPSLPRVLDLALGLERLIERLSDEPAIAAAVAAVGKQLLDDVARRDASIWPDDDASGSFWFEEVGDELAGLTLGYDGRWSAAIGRRDQNARRVEEVTCS